MTKILVTKVDSFYPHITLSEMKNTLVVNLLAYKAVSKSLAADHNETKENDSC